MNLATLENTYGFILTVAFAVSGIGYYFWKAMRLLKEINEEELQKIQGSFFFFRHKFKGGLMDELRIESPILRTTISSLINKLCKKKSGVSPDFMLQKLNINSYEHDNNLLTINLSFTIRKNGLAKIVEKIKED